MKIIKFEERKVELFKLVLYEIKILIDEKTIVTIHIYENGTFFLSRAVSNFKLNETKLNKINLYQLMFNQDFMQAIKNTKNHNFKFNNKNDIEVFEKFKKELGC